MAIKKISYFMTIGVLDGETIPAEALEDPTIVSVEAMDFLQFCEEVASDRVRFERES